MKCFAMLMNAKPEIDEDGARECRMYFAYDDSVRTVRLLAADVERALGPRGSRLMMVTDASTPDQD